MTARRLATQIAIAAVAVLTSCEPNAPSTEAIGTSRQRASTWSQHQKLLASDGTEADHLGSATSVSVDTMVVGAAGDAVNGNYGQGAAYVFQRTGLTWTEQAKLVASDGGMNHEFGSSVGIFGDTIVVGAYLHSYKGAAYVFERVGTTWTEQAKLVSADLGESDYFGYSVAIAGDTIVIGALGDDFVGSPDQGSAYVFQRTGTTWTQQAKLVASDGPHYAWFGDCVDIFADTVVVGAVDDDVGPNAEQGSAYVFQRSGTSWTQQAKLVASDGAAGDNFGDSISLSGDMVVVGSSRDDVGGAHDRGSAYVFRRAGTTWTEEAKLVASDGVPLDYFGYTVASSDDTAVVGAYHASAASSLEGTAYVFQRVGTIWTQLPKLVADTGATLDYFGFSVALAGDTLAIGAVDADDGTVVDRGSVYVFRYAKSNGDSCSSASECKSESCVDGVCCDTTCAGGSLEDCLACSVAMGAATDGTCGPSIGGTICRASSGPCDVAETCDGTGVVCLADIVAPDGTPCGGGNCTDGACNATGGNAGAGAGGIAGAPSGGAAGSEGSNPDEDEDGGCSCGTPHSPAGASSLVALSVLVLAASRRRFRARPKRKL